MKKNKNFIIISSIFGLIILTIGILNHYFYRTFAFDYAAYNFAWYDYAHLRISECPIYYWTKGMSFFQDHFSFTLIILAPLYWIFTPVFGTYSLLIIQALFIIWGGWGTYKLVELKTKNILFATLALLLYYVTYGRWASFITDVNIEIILASVVPLFLYYFEKRNFKIATLIFLFLILGRENISLWFIFIGAFLIISNWKTTKERNISILITLFSLIYFILVFKVFLPLTHVNHPFKLFNYSVLGLDPAEAVKTLIKQPFHSVKLLFINHSGDPQFDNVKSEFYFVYMFSGLFLLLFRPKYLLLIMPIIAQKMYNDEPIRWGIETYYSIEIVSLLPICVFLILNELKLKSLSTNKEILIKKIIAYSIITSSLIVTIHKFDFANRRIKWYAVDKNQFYNKKMYTSELDIPKIQNYLTLIPDSAKVAASTFIAPHLAFRPFIYYIPRVDDATYIALFKNRKHFVMSQEKWDELINDYMKSPEWEILVDDFPLLILHKTPAN
jgi:uncharacterized membrane protein